MTAAADSLDPPIGGFIALLTYFSYALIVSVGHLRDFLGKISGFSRYEYGKTTVGYSVLLKSWESFYTRRIFHRIQGNIISILNTLII
jgi:serine palmitoyltransferase